MSETKIRLLHVEDNPGDARLMHEFLREATGAEFDQVVASRLDEALRRLEAERFDVVILDLSLPDGFGLDTVRRICAAAPEVPVVVLSGTDDETLAVQAVQVGAQDYLIKSRLDAHMCPRAIRYAIERHRSRQALRSQSLTDELTGLYNRRGFLALAEQQTRVANREHCDLILLYCDLDGLKEINDTYGHPEGDQALKAAANILRETLRETDLVARIGGDEFTILALGSSGTSAATMLVRLRSSLDAYNADAGLPYRVSLSIGVACADSRRPRSVADLLAEADRTLYEQKREKRHSLPRSSAGANVNQPETV